MEDLIKHLAAGVAVAICIGFAGYLASKGNAAWGWFLFVVLTVDEPAAVAKEGAR